DDLVGGARVGGRLQDDQRARLEQLRGGLGGGLDGGQVGAVGLAQRGGHADDGGVGQRRDPGDAGDGAEAAGDHRGDVGVGQVIDVGPAGVEAADRRLPDVEAGDVQANANGLLG